MKSFLRGLFVLIILVELAGLAGWLGTAEDFTWLGLALTAGFVWAALELSHVSALTWIGALVGVGADAAASLFGWYSRLEAWDKLAHFWGGLFLGLWMLELILRALREGHLHARHKKLFLSVSVLVIVATVGFLYEFGEYLVDRFQYGYPKSLVNVYDSIEDQLFNLLGAGAVLAAYFGRLVSQRDS